MAHTNNPSNSRGQGRRAASWSQPGLETLSENKQTKVALKGHLTQIQFLTEQPGAPKDKITCSTIQIISSFLFFRGTKNKSAVIFMICCLLTKSIKCFQV